MNSINNMKIQSVIKWLMKQVKPFLLSLIIIIILGALLSLCGTGIALTSKWLIDSAISKNEEQAFVAGIIFVVIILSQLIVRAVYYMLSSNITESMTNYMQQSIYKYLSQVEWYEFSKYHSGDILTRLTSDVGIISNVIIQVIPSLVSFGVGFIAAFITLLFFDPTLALLALFLGPISVITSKIFGRKLKHIHHQVQKSESNNRSYLQECIQNMNIIKIFSSENKSYTRIKHLQKEKYSWILKRNRLSVITNSILSAGYWIGYFMTFCWGALRLLQGLTTFGTLTAFLQLVQQVQSPFIGLARTIPQIISMIASAERLIELENLKVDKYSDIYPEFKEASIAIEDICYGYEVSNPLFINISLHIKSGDIIGLIGTSGEGKTTLVRLLLAFIKPQSGTIYFTNNNGDTIIASTDSRHMIAYVPQGNTLFSGTIMDNLKLGNPDVTVDEIKTILIGLNFWSFIEKQPEGLYSIIGEDGLGLSEGQAQRLSIARALLKKAPILILDELSDK